MSIKKVLKKIFLFKHLSDKNLKKIISLGKLKKYRPGEMVFDGDSAGNALYIVIAGVVKIFAQAGIKKKTLAYLNPGEFFGEMSLIDLKPRSASSVALEECELMVIEKKDFNALISKDTDLIFYILKTLTIRLRNADKEIERLSFRSLPARLAKALVDLTAKYSKKTRHGAELKMKLSHQDLAEIAGTSREVVSRQLNIFKRLRYIDIIDKKIFVMNIHKLKKLCMQKE